MLGPCSLLPLSLPTSYLSYHLPIPINYLPTSAVRVPGPFLTRACPLARPSVCQTTFLSLFRRLLHSCSERDEEHRGTFVCPFVAPVFYRTSSPSGPLPCFPLLQFTITQSRATGIADHILPLGDLLSILSIPLLPRCPSDLLQHCCCPPARD